MAKKTFFIELSINPQFSEKFLISENVFYFFTAEFSHFWGTKYFFFQLFFLVAQQRPDERQKFLPTASNKNYLLQKKFCEKFSKTRSLSTP
jgi:hypothetical protein